MEKVSWQFLAPLATQVDTVSTLVLKKTEEKPPMLKWGF